MHKCGTVSQPLSNLEHCFSAYAHLIWRRAEKLCYSCICHCINHLIYFS